MFFHGIPYKYIQVHYPVISPRHNTEDLTEAQKADSRHLIERFGLEPVHLLAYERGVYGLKDCLTACFSFGDVVFAFCSLSPPLLQLSTHEVGVKELDLREARWIFLNGVEHQAKIQTRFPGIKVFVCTEEKHTGI
ncbi:hypothetical protein DFP93_10429 [Aneurinibacillus soli]|uniref:Uncharacterized protein n=1 Tax=Aneurinibacillus soli TaxID=1500254 RepID=A0A0U5AXH3_9BACL|nr:hypothetical protein [Aneurinibacillus soli]PYE62383.1 hypothetical protein DFP93_10429 [Aneurinibacillus soli]BAU26946.1 hypothetical protein CB4_01115 [Aneurinibacillus soli]